MIGIVNRDFLLECLREVKEDWPAGLYSLTGGRPSTLNSLIRKIRSHKEGSLVDLTPTEESLLKGVLEVPDYEDQDESIGMSRVLQFRSELRDLGVTEEQLGRLGESDAKT